MFVPIIIGTNNDVNMKYAFQTKIEVIDYLVDYLFEKYGIRLDQKQQKILISENMLFLDIMRLYIREIILMDRNVYSEPDILAQVKECHHC